MPRYTKAQKKRMLRAILAKTLILYGLAEHTGTSNSLVNMKEFDNIRKMVARGLKRLG